MPQEPQLTAGKNVFENVMEAVEPIKAILRRYDEINAKFGEDLDPDAMDKLLAEQARVQDLIDLHNAWELIAKSRSRWTR